MQRSIEKSAERVDAQRTTTNPSERFAAVRALTRQLIEGLSAEDAAAQSMPDASPAKWHLAHTTWFFETFVAIPFAGYAPFDPDFSFLFNSYYEALGPRVARAQRGLLTRPPLERVLEYRRTVDAQILELLHARTPCASLSSRLELGLQHEQQHQELLLTDLKHLFWSQPLRPAYRQRACARESEILAAPLTYSSHSGGLVAIGHTGGGFRFDNEAPRHRYFLAEFQLADRLVTNGEYLAFIQDGGYERPELWLSDGFRWLQEDDIRCPLYWQREAESFSMFTLHGMQRLELAAPVCHVSYYEADAYARWAGARLPSEAEWETAAQDEAIVGNFLDSRELQPCPANGRRQIFGDVWEWTQSAYAAYPGFEPLEGALGEYNGKFMCNQMVLRGGSCASPREHLRATYRNFFPASARWQFSGIRLATQA